MVNTCVLVVVAICIFGMSVSVIVIPVVVSIQMNAAPTSSITIGAVTTSRTTSNTTPVTSTNNTNCSSTTYWDTATGVCIPKKLWNQTCGSSLECYNGGGLACQPVWAANTTVCDCANYTLYWTGFLNNNYSGYCATKKNYGVTSFNCTSTYQCQDYNNVTCINNQCTCYIDQYWNGITCSPRLNYSNSCNSTLMCRNWSGGPNLQCLVAPGSSAQQCFCSPTQYFHYCDDYCYSSKSWQQSCNVSTCYATSMCDQTRSLSCINNVCNCTNIEWWNTTACVPKGTNLSPCVTGQHYQCQQYNLLSCVGSQCVCGSTMYWSSGSSQCQLKRSFGGVCASTVQCISSAGVGLSCFNGTCSCSSGYAWNTPYQQCDPIG